MAMGARASEVFALLCRQTLGPNLIGMMIGFALFLALRQSVARYLYVVEPDHAPTYIVASIVP
jgi:hypothetical protein